AEKRLPFEPLVPNAETVAAMEAPRRGALVTVGDVDGLMANLHAEGQADRGQAGRLRRMIVFATQGVENAQPRRKLPLYGSFFLISRWTHSGSASTQRAIGIRNRASR
ncbi:MAG: hypothetical protein OXC54_00750, partial [Rhodospirillaceae bacterium]|nr:hypothetical protein [Rhodospirillaceae bacterium]